MNKLISNKMVITPIVYLVDLPFLEVGKLFYFKRM